MPVRVYVNLLIAHQGAQEKNKKFFGRKKKKTSYWFCLEVPLGPTGKEFLLESKIG